ncbi:hypothetical protein ANO11243_091340 [Dothideomycetidae sp. 11243]|nr:hypothetical protein ANO11243_091340 [fungal sp. No.11243]
MPPAFARPTKEGKVPFKVATLDKPCFTSYKIWGDVTKTSPLVVVHGGPAGTFKSALGAIPFWTEFGLPVVMYDQIGCGESTLLPEKYDDESFWRPPLFIAELNNVLDILQLRNGFYLFGEDWSATLAAEFASSRPRGLKKLVLAAPYGSTALHQISIDHRLSELPCEVQRAAKRAHDTGDYKSESYKQARLAWFKHVLLRVLPWAPELEDIILHSGIVEHPVRQIMIGSSEFHSEGSLRDWNIVDQLHKINVPTLMYSGEFDTSYDIASRPFFERIPKVRWVVFPGVGHGVMADPTPQSARCLRILMDFLLKPAASDEHDESVSAKTMRETKSISLPCSDTKSQMFIKHDYVSIREVSNDTSARRRYSLVLLRVLTSLMTALALVWLLCEVLPSGWLVVPASESNDQVAAMGLWTRQTHPRLNLAQRR